MPAKRIVVIGASSGGFEALRVIADALPHDFAAPVCAVLHMAPDSPGTLVSVLNSAGRVRARTAETGMRLENGCVYLAQPDHHLIVEPGVLRLTKGPRENRFRPAIDPLFRSAAQVYGPGAIGVVLTGSLDDGTAGLWAIKRLGGIAIVQDPSDALFPSMPLNATRHVDVDYSVPLVEVVPQLAKLLDRAVDEEPVRIPEALEVEMRIARDLNAIDAGLEQVGDPSPFSCPECHGVLLRLKEAQPLRFRCHTGHAYSIESLIAAVNEGIDVSLWTTMRALEEGALLLQHAASHTGQDADARSVALSKEAADAHRLAERVRRLAAERGALEPLSR